MGSFPGHVIPGTFFCAFATWWLTQIPRRRFMCEQKGIPYFNTVTFPIPNDKLSRIPVEGLVKMLFSVVGMICELIASADYGHVTRLRSTSDLQHFTMYSMFLVSGFVDCVVFRGSKLVPVAIDYVTLTLAFVVEWILFYNHVIGRGRLDITVHVLLLYGIAGSIISTVLELTHSGEMFTFLRSYFTLLQGTWFIQIAFILYPPTPHVRQWSDTDWHVTLACLVFTWHMLGVFMFTCFVYTFISTSYRRHCRIFDFHVEYQLTSRGWTLRKLRQKTDGDDVRYTSLPTDSEDEHVMTENTIHDDVSTTEI